MRQPPLHTGSHDLPVSPALAAYMRTGWADTERIDLSTHPAVPYISRRREQLHARFAGHRIVIAAGGFQRRSNDTDFRFRPHSNYTWLTGDQSSDGVLVIASDGSPTLYLRPRSDRKDDEFYRDRRYGELWNGRRLTLLESSRRYALPTRHIAELEHELGTNTPTLLVRGVDPRVDRLIPANRSGGDGELTAALDELRLIKDTWEIAQLQDAVAATTRGFEDVVRALPQARRTSERHLEGIFWLRARVDGNDVGYHSIVAAGAHAATLHWTDNDGPVRDGDLLLLDAGVETRTLYTADITRILPISGRFSPLQRDLYELCRRANDVALTCLRPGAPFRSFHLAAMAVLAQGLEDMGVLPCSAVEALDEQSGLHRRWTLCGSGHMLGLDVHDCAAAPAGQYLDGVLQPGHVLTVEPGLYFQPDDELIPAELRGMGFRIEEDILITEDGYRILSADLPRTAAEVETWMDRVATS